MAVPFIDDLRAVDLNFFHLWSTIFSSDLKAFIFKEMHEPYSLHFSNLKVIIAEKVAYLQNGILCIHLY